MSYTAHSEMNPVTMQVSTTGLIIRDSDGAVIPPDNDNIDYQDYLAWVADGNAASTYSAQDVSYSAPTDSEIMFTMEVI